MGRTDEELTRIRELLEQQQATRSRVTRNVLGAITLIAIVLGIAGYMIYDKMAHDDAIERIYLSQFGH